jgi:prepilin peptidase CpaA
MGGIALATVKGVLCWLRGMGMGDLKLCAAVGAWISPGQLGIVLVATGMAGGVLLDKGCSSPPKLGSR